MVIATTADIALTTLPHYAPPAIVGAGLTQFLQDIPNTSKVALLWGFPSPGDSHASPTICLSKGASSIQECTYRATNQEVQYNLALQQAALQHGALAINQYPWLCAAACPAIISGMIIYTPDGFHMDSLYVNYLTGVLWAALMPDLN